ncbi:MAG: hypothetical protein ABFS28_03740 [Bacteroidota bacterium]
MKRLLLLVLVSGYFLSSSMAQEIELTGFGGFTFNSKIRTYYGDYKVNDNPNYGGILSVGLAPDVFVELMYNRHDSKIRYAYTPGIIQPLDMATEYYHVGGLTQIPVGSGNIKPFGAVSFGATRFYLKESYGNLYSASEWKMSAAVGVGTKILLGNALGIRLQARLGLPLDFNGLWIGTGGSGANFRVPMVQFDLSAGLILRLGGGGA